MKLKYINRIKSNITFFSSKKTSNILDGTYRSSYKGKSMNFDNLREYNFSDDVKDIDWKSSARKGKPLVKQFIAERKHNIMFIMDTGIKMDADTDKHESKKEIALYTAGTLAYIAIKNGDYIGMMYSKENKIEYKPFKYNLYNLEQYLFEYDKDATVGGITINDILLYLEKNFSRRMIVVVITDLDGLESIDESLLKKIRQVYDILFININDNNLFGDDIFDVNDNIYVPEMFLEDKKLNEIEVKLKNDLYDKNKNKLKNNKISITSISSIKEINIRIIELLEEHRYASSK